MSRESNIGMIRHRNLRILIVEDDSVFISALNEKLSVIWSEFPDAEITMVRTLWRALEIAKRAPAPDVVLLDLTLSDATARETADKLSEMQERSSVVIISGHSIQEIQKLVGTDTEVLIKDQQIWRGGKIIDAIIRSVKRRSNPETEDIWQLLEKTRKMIE